jgi:DNA repair exonuclease SbcCD ATPase subunit/predicted MPP superfamily phosphohydrolase
MIKKIKTNVKKLDRIFHLSDIHIRNFKRHDEYRRVFERTRDYILSQNTENSLIFVTGDIVHSKTDVSPELVQEVQSFFRTLLEAAEVVVTAGNHDANLNNNHRLDTLTPIINAINSDRIHYLRDTGVYEIAGKHVFVWSVFDSKDSYPRAKDFECDYKIATFHGPVTNAVTDIGFTLHHESISVGDFEGFDVVLLGDIHKRQFLNERKSIAYPGSLIQQNHAESITHGILVWDLEKKTAESVDVYNDTCHFTLELSSGIASEIPKNLPPNVYLRIKHKNSSQSDVKKLISSVKKKHNIIETSVQRVNDVNDSSLGDRKLNVIDVRDVEYQNKVISNYLKDKYDLSQDQINEVCEVNRFVNKHLPKSDKCRNVVWTPKLFEFDNMFSYGKGNVIDFSNMQGVYGIFAANASGKSTLLDSIMYCIFDKCSKTHKGVQVMNNQCNSFRCKLVLELDGIEYTIERNAIRQKNGNVKVDVDFFYKSNDGTIISLNGKERSDTNSNIRNVLGTYEDFVLTSVSAQNNNTGFIDMNQKDRKELLSQFLDISVFEELYGFASNEIKEVSVLLREHQKENYFETIFKQDTEIEVQDSIIKSGKKEKQDLETQKQVINSSIIEHSIKITPIDESITHIDQLLIRKDKIESGIKTLEDAIVTEKQKLSLVFDKTAILEKEKSSLDEKEISSGLSNWKIYNVKFNEAKDSVKLANLELKHTQEKLSKLKDLKYDPNCSFCMENVFVKDAIEASSSYCNSVKDLETKQNELLKVENTLSGSMIYVEKMALYEKLQKLEKDLHIEEVNLRSSIQSIETKKKEANNLLEDTKNKIQQYHQQEKSIEENERLNIEITSLKSKLSSIETAIETINDKILEAQTAKRTAEIQKERCRESLSKFKELENKFKNYQYYLEATHRDGVPHTIISSVIPKIEEEINNILNQLVEFSVILQTDDKNINAYIAYDEKRFWPIELTSGMEKFVSSLAIRTSLINISTLPRPSFMVIDEGFGSLSPENLGSMYMFFEYLKTQFKFIMIVSHIESMKDMVDKQIEINKVNGRSAVQHVS